jgi:hypothetical protein
MSDEARAPIAGPAKVLFILGTTRCGSTIVENVLGSVPGFFAAGEVHMLWRGIEWGFRCGCGTSIPECPVWSRVLERVGNPPASVVHRWQLADARMLHTPRLMRIRDWPITGRPNLDRYVALLRRLYPAIADVSEADVVVDSSKTPAAATILSHLDEVDLYLVHLVRDPRGVVHSWSRGQPGGEAARGPGNYAPGAIRTTSRWIATNRLGEAVRRRLPDDRVMIARYEDFVADPAGFVERIKGFVGVRTQGTPVLSERVVQLHGNHIASGNRSRFARGRIEIRLDDEWLASRGIRTSLVTTLSFPWLSRYGYAVRPGSA